MRNYMTVIVDYFEFCDSPGNASIIVPSLLQYISTCIHISVSLIQVMNLNYDER